MVVMALDDRKAAQARRRREKGASSKLATGKQETRTAADETERDLLDLFFQYLYVLNLIAIAP